MSDKLSSRALIFYGEWLLQTSSSLPSEVDQAGILFLLRSRPAETSPVRW